MKQITAIGLALVALALAACGPTAIEPTPTAPIIRLPTQVAAAGAPSARAVATPASTGPTASATATPTRVLWAPLPTGIPSILIPATPTPVPPTSTPVATPALIAPALAGRLLVQTSSGGDIIVATTGGRIATLTQGLDPAWSPDGAMIAFTRWTEPQGVYVMNADGSGLRLIYRINGAKSPTWSPDGTRIAFTWLYKTVQRQPPRGIPSGFAGIARDYWRISVINLKTGEKTDAPMDADGHAFSPHWGPDGRIVYKGVRGLFVTDEAGPPVQITDDPWHWSPMWSPDGTRIAFMARRHDHWDIGVVNSDGGGLMFLTESPFVMFTRPINTVAPVWSPDGRSLAFLSDRGGEWRVYVMNTDGSSQRPLLDVPIVYDYAAERVMSWAR